MTKCHCAAINKSECICTKVLWQAEKKLENKKEKIVLMYDAELGAYRIPSIVDRSKFTVLNAYCEIIKNDRNKN